MTSLRSIQVIAGVLGRAGEAGQKKRIEAAQNGEITWQPPPGLGRPVTEDDRRRAAEAQRTGKRGNKEIDGDQPAALGSEVKTRHGGRRPQRDNYDL